MSGNETPVFLSEIEAQQFLEWQKYREDFLSIVEAGVFETKNGTAVLNFNANGELTYITVNKMVWKQ